jgi:hypothetical protein
MRVKTTILAATLTILGVLGSQGLGHEPEAIQDPDGPGPVGHTIDELRRDIKVEVKRVGQRLGDVGDGIRTETVHISNEVAQRLEGVKREVNKMPLQHRVYARMHWDKTLQDAKIEVHALRDGEVLLRGKVPSEAARDHAVQLASDVVGVTSVVDELTFPKRRSSKASVKTPAAPATSDAPR